MRAYRQMFLAGLQSTLQYKLNSLFYLTYVIIPPVAVFFLWQAILGTGGRLGDYDLPAIVTYYVVTQLLVANTSFSAWSEIGDSIRNGRLALWLVRPASHYGLYLARVFSSLVLLWAMSLGGLGLVAFFLRGYLQVQTDPVLVVAALALWLGGAALAFTIGYLANLLAFWTERATGALGLLGQTAHLLAGNVVPLDLLPLPGLWLSLPFRFAGWLPAQVYLGRIGKEALPIEFVKLLLWLVALFALSHWIWRRGLRRFQGAGT